LPMASWIGMPHAQGVVAVPSDYEAISPRAYRSLAGNRDRSVQQHDTP
jgi:hypothetical protein